MTELSRKRDRDRLDPRREPYWQRLGVGAYLGFRRGADTWVARFRDRNGTQQYHALGRVLDFDVAKERAEAWLSQFTSPAVHSAKSATVIAALDAYVQDLRRHERADSAKRAAGHFKKALGWDRRTGSYTDPLADLKLRKATRNDFEEWRDRLRSGVLPRTVNRTVRAVVAGLNQAGRLGHAGNPSAWKFQSLPDDEYGTAVFLSPIQRRGLIASAAPRAAAFLRGLELTGGRPKELAAATVGDFKSGRLKLSHRTGRPPTVRSRYVDLDKEAVKFFGSQAKSKKPSDPLFCDGESDKAWRRDRWAAELNVAIAAHNKSAKGGARVPDEASAYSFRHSRIRELLQVYGIDPLTVATQTGSSVLTIERSYLKFIRSG